METAANSSRSTVACLRSSCFWSHVVKMYDLKSNGIWIIRSILHKRLIYRTCYIQISGPPLLIKAVSRLSSFDLLPDESNREVESHDLSYFIQQWIRSFRHRRQTRRVPIEKTGRTYIDGRSSESDLGLFRTVLHCGPAAVTSYTHHHQSI